MRVKNKKIKQ